MEKRRNMYDSHKHSTLAKVNEKCNEKVIMAKSEHPFQSTTYWFCVNISKYTQMYETKPKLKEP